MFRASTAHSGRNSSEFRHPVRGSECASQRARKRFRKRLRIRLQIRLQSRERSGAKRRGSERSQRAKRVPRFQTGRDHGVTVLCRRRPATPVHERAMQRGNRSLWAEFLRIPARRLRAVVIGRCLRAASPRRLRRAGVREAWRATQASRACCRPEHATPARDPACPAAPLNQPGASAGPDSGTRASPTHPDSVAPNPADAGGECSCTSGRRPSLLRGCT